MTKKKTSKFFKRLFIVTITAAICLLLYFAEKVYFGSKNYLPVPYRLSKDLYPSSPKIENANVLVAGDENALKLERFIPKIVEESSKKLANKLKINIIAQKHEALFRTMERIKSLNKVPKLIFYFAGNSEFYEKKFNLEDKSLILENIKKYNSPKISSLLISFPRISGLFYREINPVKLKNISKDETSYSGYERHQQMELTYRLYQIELEEFIRFLRKNDSKLIIITKPHHYLKPPYQDCSNTMKSLTTAKLESYKDKLKSKNYKEASGQGLELTKEHPGHASIHYYMGMNALYLGLLKRSRELLKLAKSYDCFPHGGSPILNAIQEKIADRRQLEIIDFDSIVNANLGKDELFIHDDQPQEIYYEQVQEKMIEIIKEFYNI